MGAFGRAVVCRPGARSRTRSARGETGEATVEIEEQEHADERHGDRRREVDAYEYRAKNDHCHGDQMCREACERDFHHIRARAAGRRCNPERISCAHEV